MQLKVLKEDEKTLMLEVEGETVTFTNLLRKELWQDKSVSEASEKKEHPYIGGERILVKTERGSPRVALDKAATRISGQAKEFGEEFKRALKK
jgi:DNA-directed RNA polymerase subunit L